MKSSRKSRKVSKKYDADFENLMQNQQEETKEEEAIHNREDPSHEADMKIDANSEVRARLVASEREIRQST